MSNVERELKNNILKIGYYVKNLDMDYSFKEKSMKLIKYCFSKVTDNLVETLKNINLELIVDLIDNSINLPEAYEICEKLVKIFFDLDPAKNNFYIRALLAKAQIEARLVERKNLKADEAISQLKISMQTILKAVELIQKPENKAKLGFLLYNISIVAFNIYKKNLIINWSKHFFEVLEKIMGPFEETDDIDYSWRLRFIIKLVMSYIDAEKKQEATKALDKITDLLKKKGECEFQEELFRIRIHLSRDNNNALGVIKKEGESLPESRGFKYIYTVQCLKSGIINEQNAEKEINILMNQLFPDFTKIVADVNLSSKIDYWRADILAELAFICFRLKLYTLAMNIYDVLSRLRSNSLKGKIFLENLRAQLLIYKLELELKSKTLPEEETRTKRIDVRIEALKILERNLSGCNRVMDLDLINETAMLIWNTALPFMKKSLRKNYYKAFNSAAELLEQTESNETFLRASLHFETAKYLIEDDLLSEADTNLIKALTMDYSIPINKLPFPPKPEDNLNYLQRNLEQYLVYLKRCVTVKTNTYSDPDNTIDILISESDNLKNAKNEEIRLEILKKCNDLIIGFELSEFTYDKEKDLVEEEINDMKRKHELKLYDDKKHFTLASYEIAKYAYEYNQFQSVIDTNTKINKIVFNPQKDIDQFIAQSMTNLLAARSYEEFLLTEGIEVGYNTIFNFLDNSKVYSDQEIGMFNVWKQNMLDCIKEAVRLAVSAFQHWLVFNCAVQLWNSFLPIFKSPNFLQIVNDNLIPVMTDTFEALNNAVIYLEQTNAETTDTDFFNKIDLFVNLTSHYARILESKGKQDECIRICDVMLGRKIKSNYRKIFDTIKSRALKNYDPKKGGPKPAQAKPQAGGKKDEKPIIYTPTPDQVLTSECFSLLEAAVINKDEKTKLELLKKGYDSLKNYKVQFHDENSIELNSELWYKYGVQYYQFNNPVNYKQALVCSDNCIKTFVQSEISKMSNNRLKWYAVGFLLFGDCLFKLVDTKKQERVSQIKLYFESIEKYQKAALLAEKCKEYYTILQSLKAFYLSVIQIIDQQQNRVELVPYFSNFHDILISNKVQVLFSDPDFLLLFYSIFCTCINEKKEWSLGEKVISEAVKYIPDNYKSFLNEHRLFYMSKQGKSFLQSLTGSDEKDVVSKAKLYVKLARSSANKVDQFNAYSKAIELLKNDDNVVVTDIMFEMATWLYKNNHPIEDVEEQLLQATDVLLEIEPIFDEEDNLDDDMTLHSKKSSSSRRSRISKRSHSKITEKSKKRSEKAGKGSIKTKASAITKKSRNYSNKDVKTKSVFSKLLDQDPYPLFLNQNHLEQLIKIHIVLSMVSNDKTKALEYILDAFYFVMKMFELSFKTLNCLDFYEKNKADIDKFTIDKGGNPLQSLIRNYFLGEVNIPIVYTLPESLEGWLNFEFPPFFLKKIREFEDNTFFSKKAFEKPQQFYFYLKYMIDKCMKDYYLHTQCIPLLKFSILFAEFILNSQEMRSIYVLKLKRLLHNIVNTNASNKIDECLKGDLFSLNMTNILLSQEKVYQNREDLRKININLDTDNSFLNDNYELNSPILLIDNVKIHHLWIDLASELFYFGYLNMSKEYLEEIFFHCLVLKDKTTYIQTRVLQAKIYFCEANFDRSFEVINSVQEINTDLDVLLMIVIDISFMLNSLKKYEELINYLNNVSSFIITIEDSKVYNLFTLNKLKLFIAITMIKLGLKKIKSVSTLDETLSIYKTLSEQYSTFDTISEKCQSIMNVEEMLEYVELTLETILNNCFFLYVNKPQLDLICNLFENSLNHLIKSQNFLNNLQTYVPYRSDSRELSLPIHRLIAIVKINYCKINNLIGELKSRIKRESSLITNLEDNDGNKLKYDQKVIDYLNALTKEMNKINSENEGIRQNRYEKSISVLLSIENGISFNSNEFIQFYVEKINSYRLQAMHNKELKRVWNIESLNLSKPNPENPSSTTIQLHNFHQLALNYTNDFDKILNERPYIYYSNFSTNFSQSMLNYYFNFVELIGYLNIELTMKNLFEYQNQFSKINLKKVVYNYLTFESRDYVTNSTLKSCKNFFEFSVNSQVYPESISNYIKSLSELPYFKFLLNRFNWDEVKGNLPNNSSYFIFQMSEDKAILYIGFMYYNLERKLEYYVKRILMNNLINKDLDDIISSVRKMKHSLIKSVIVTKEELLKIENGYNDSILLMSNFFKTTLNEVWDDLEKIINPVEVKQDDSKDKNKKAPAQKKDQKSSLPDIELPLSGIESITFLIDYRFFDLPFDQIPVFSKIPLKSYDFSLSCLYNRLKSNNFNCANSNNISVEKANLKYYLDYKQSLKIDLKKSVDTKMSVSSGKTESKIEGITSSDHYPSVAELQKLYSNSSIFMFVSQTSFLYQFPPYEILESSKFTKCKLAIIQDRVTCVKNYVDQKSLIPKTFSLTTQPLDMIALLTVCGVVSIMINKWSIDMDETCELIDDIVSEATKGYPMSFTLMKYKLPKVYTEESNNPQDKEASKKGLKDKDVKKPPVKEAKVEEIQEISKGPQLIEKKEFFTYSPILFGFSGLKIN